ncbi:hypothetical protein ScPMuIL_000723 [Solemya velum]
MENSPYDDQSEDIGEFQQSENLEDSAASLKIKLKEGVHRIEQNGLNGSMNHIDASQENSKHSDKHRSSGHSSSSSKSKEHHSSSSKSKDGSSKSRDHHSSSSSKHKDGSSSSSKHKDGSSSKSKDGHHSSSSHKSKDGSSSSKHRDGSSSHSKDKHHSSSKDRPKESSSRDGEKHRDKSKDKQRERTKDGDKHREKDRVREGEKHREKSDRPKESSSLEKHKDRQESQKQSPTKYSSRHNDLGSPRESLEVKCEREIKIELSDVVDEPDSPLKTNLHSPVKVRSPEKTFFKEERLSDDDDVPLSDRMKVKEEPVKRKLEDSDDDEPLSARMDKVKKIKQEKKTKKRKHEDDEKPSKKKKIKTEKGAVPVASPKKGKATKQEAEQQVWRWWEEDRREDGVKWNFLEHKGPVLAPDYEPLPDHVRFYYDGKEMKLSPNTEEVATFYGRMLDHDYTSKDIFNDNFFKDWRKVMTPKEKEILKDLKKCKFNEINDYFKQQSEERKNRTKEQKLKLKTQNEEMMKEYGFCIMDGHKEKIGNFKIEPPGLFRGRGDHPKQGMLKTRTMPEDVIINCSKDSKIPQPPEGHKWKEVRHDNKVTWLACWNENIQGSTKYVMLNAASRLKGEKDWNKYEIARKLHKCVDKIRAQYREDWKSKEMRKRQRAVALYFIDKLALRAGNEKEEGETADTVGCCSLRVEHLKLHNEFNGKECVVEFDFLGKDSIRYYNAIPVEKRVYKNLQLFMDNKQPGDDLFDRLNTAILNKHLSDLMEGLTAKVFRTYNASRTLQEQLDVLTQEDDSVPAKLLSYNRANRAVAVLCNHQRAVPKNFDKQMENLQVKIDAKKEVIREAKKQVKRAKSDYKSAKTDRAKMVYEKKKKMQQRLEEQLTKLEVQATDKDENKEIALGTSKLNYLDPRISVAWCKKWEVPIEKIYNKTQRDKFRWAIDMVGPDFVF